MLNKIEIRVNNISDALLYDECEIDEIGIGNEGCVLKVPNIEEISGLVSVARKRVKLVLPFIPQSYIGNIKKFIKEIVDRKLCMSLVVNDLGVLSYLQTIDTSNLEIMVGRFLDWSYSLVPWANNILREEESDTFQYAMQSSLYDNKKFELLKNMKVTGIELNATKRNIEVSSDLVKAGFTLYLHYGFNILATSRACPYKRMNEKILCSQDCDTPMKFSIKEKWMPSTKVSQGKLSTEYFHKDDMVEHLFPKMYLKNNMVLRKNEFSLEELLDSEYVNVIISEDLIENQRWLEEKLEERK